MLSLQRIFLKQMKSLKQEKVNIERTFFVTFKKRKKCLKESLCFRVDFSLMMNYRNLFQKKSKIAMFGSISNMQGRLKSGLKSFKENQNGNQEILIFNFSFWMNLKN